MKSLTRTAKRVSTLRTSPVGLLARPIGMELVGQLPNFRYTGSEDDAFGLGVPSSHGCPPCGRFGRQLRGMR